MIKVEIFAISILFIIGSNVWAQENPPVPTNPDSNKVSYNLELDSLYVYPKDDIPPAIQRTRSTLAHGNPVHKFAAETELTTVIPGVTADLERDLPELITFYTNHGLPILTKQTQNHSLTPTIPYTLIRPELDEPDAMLSGSDAIVTYTPTYGPKKNLFIDPLHQGGSIATGERGSFSGALIAEHSSPELLEPLIKELGAYAKTYSGLAAAKIKKSRTELEVTAQHQYSDNEFGALFDVLLFRETDNMHSIFTNATHNFRDFTLEAGYGLQHAEARTQLDEVYKDYHSMTDKLRAHNVKLSLQKGGTKVALFYHDIQRKLPEKTTGVRDAQLLVKQDFAFRNQTHFTMQGRLDHHDQKTEPSFSTKIIHEPAKNLFLEASVAHLYDPVTNHSMSSGLRDATVHSAPITTSYSSLKASYKPSEWQFSTSFTAKKVSLSWYEQPSEIKGMLLGTSAQRIIPRGNHAFAFRVNARKRWMNLEVNNEISQMPGPAPLQIGAHTEYAANRFGVTLDAHFYSERTQSLSKDHITSLGQLVLFNAGFTWRISSVNVGLTIDNVFGIFRENKMYAYQKRISDRDSEVDYIVAPPFIPGISTSIDF